MEDYPEVPTGELLREMRRYKQWTIKQAAQKTNFSTTAIEALEAENWKDPCLPQPTVALRNYANEIGLDPAIPTPTSRRLGRPGVLRFG